MPKLSDRPSAKQSPAVYEPTYTVSLEDRIETGTAFEILSSIQAHAIAESSLKKMSLERYAKEMVNSAPDYVPEVTLQFLKSKQYSSIYDRALEHLAAMPSAGVLILARHEPTDRPEKSRFRRAI